MTKFKQYTTVFIVVGAALMFYVGIFLPKLEKHECITWQAQRLEFEGATATAWQVEQCNRYHITI